ncbi:hypothetical protein GCM10010919_15870 [Alishewanella longhuensis]|uniref:Glycosyl transferase n=1 Tax=Alishewanella longhuensis TaxID=1091037 RepID=A0ABQ3L5X5_9ALTE|nr:glycosyltransferase family 4 protein [Alishewanella longhuensis]GHG67287.1 hypothetical protein GCM10010919_15870 [Alishewanella longhuensis]
MASTDRKVLIITNMGPKASAPFQGQFVASQVTELNAQGQTADYHYMRWHGDSLLNRLLKYPVFLLDFLWRFIFCRQRYQLIHVHFFYPTIYLALLYRVLRNRRVKIVVTCHGSDIYHYQPPGRLYRWCAKQVQAWVFTSERLSQQFFFTPAQQQVLSAGIQGRYAATKCVPLAEKDIDILYVGTLDKNKGMDRLIALLAELSPYRIVVAGTGPWQEALTKAAQGVSHLQLLGAQSPAQLQALYQRARCFISLSRNESFGLVMAEAMACYTPVIATETDGSQAQVLPAVTGYRISQQQSEPELIQQLAQHITQLLTLSADQYAVMQQACRQQAEPVLLPKVVSRLRQLYQDLDNDQHSTT